MAVYFIQFPTGAIKIGYTDAPLPRRISQLEGHHGVPLSLLHVVPGGREEEAEWHERFAAARIGKTEQFRPIPELMAAIGRPVLVGVNPEAIEAVPSVRPKPWGKYVRMEDELVEKAKVIAAIKGVSLGELFSPVLWPFIKNEWKKQGRKMVGDQEGED